MPTSGEATAEATVAPTAAAQADSSGVEQLGNAFDLERSTAAEGE